MVERRIKMNKKIYAHKCWLVTVLSFILVMSSTNAFAWGGRDRNDRGSHRREVVMVGHQTYHYHDGRFFRPGWFGFEIVVAIPPIGAIVTFLPFGHRTIIVGGLTYYYYDNVYYRACPSGYIVDPGPAVTVSPAGQYQAVSGETVTINVPNSNGSYTPVTLVKRNNGYIGPQGEYYGGHPTVEQLKALYGK
jgi:hypothetical protein